MDEVPITPRSIKPFGQIVGQKRTQQFVDELAKTRSELDGATVWHVNSTAAGGGVAEMLQSVLSYPAASGINVRWLVIEAPDEFFELTKRVHHLLHGSSGDDGPLEDKERRLYERTLHHEEKALTGLVKPRDVVILHDPQVVGLARGLTALGAAVIWSCHIGADAPNPETCRAWDFLLPYVGETVAQTFTRSQYRWENLAGSRVAVIPPCIDAFATKNQPLRDGDVRAILDATAILPTRERTPRPRFVRQDDSLASVTHTSRMIDVDALESDAPIVCQVSRWDPLKDHAGLMRAFVSEVSPDLRGQLVLAGPSTDSVDDDPESKETFEELVHGWEELALDSRRRVHICSLPMDDVDENAAIVNALQRRADVIVQKSLAEGFGLTVAEAMWKRRPTVGSRIGGIQDQIESGESGLLIDPTDRRELGQAIMSLLSNPAAAAKMGENGRRRVIDDYLAPSYLTRQFGLIREVLGRTS